MSMLAVFRVKFTLQYWTEMRFRSDVPVIFWWICFTQFHMDSYSAEGLVFKRVHICNSQQVNLTDQFFLHHNNIYAIMKEVKFKIWYIISWLNGEITDEVIWFRTKASQLGTHWYCNRNHDVKGVIIVHVGDDFHIWCFQDIIYMVPDVIIWTHRDKYKTT